MAVHFLPHAGTVEPSGGDTDTSRDYEYTDWRAVDRFARELVEERTDESVAATREPPAARAPGLEGAAPR